MKEVVREQAPQRQVWIGNEIRVGRKYSELNTEMRTDCEIKVNTLERLGLCFIRKDTSRWVLSEAAKF